MEYVVYEQWGTRPLLPFTYCRPVFDLRSGIYTPLERAAALFHRPPECIFVRPEHADVMRERTSHPVNETFDGAVLFLDGSLQLTRALAEQLRSNVHRSTVYTVEGDPVAVFTNDEDTRNEVQQSILHDGALTYPANIETIPLEAEVIRYPWDLVINNEAMIRADARLFELGSWTGISGVEYVHPQNIYIDGAARLGKNIVLDASEGPIVIDEHASVMHNSVVIGPAYVGKNSRLKVGTKLYENTSIGPVCKVGGEVEGSILHSYANKQHEGFLGHSYLAPWTNLGADTNTSDLKNNYSEISVIVEGKKHETRTMFLGLMLGDHSKSGINTMFNTGTCIGVGCNIYGGGFPPKYVPSFSWGGSDELVEYDIERFLVTARTVYNRRNLALTEAEERLLRDVFQKTSSQRTYE